MCSVERLCRLLNSAASSDSTISHVPLDSQLIMSQHVADHKSKESDVCVRPCSNIRGGNDFLICGFLSSVVAVGNPALYIRH